MAVGIGNFPSQSHVILGGIETLQTSVDASHCHHAAVRGSLDMDCGGFEKVTFTPTTSSTIRVTTIEGAPIIRSTKKILVTTISRAKLGQK